MFCQHKAAKPIHTLSMWNMKRKKACTIWIDNIIKMLLLLMSGDSSVGRVSNWKAGHTTDVVWQGFFPPESTSSADSYNAHAAPVCNRMHQHLCTHSKSHTLLAIPLFGHTRILHMLVGMGSAALTADVPSYKGQWSTKKKKKIGLFTIPTAACLEVLVFFCCQRMPMPISWSRQQDFAVLQLFTSSKIAKCVAAVWATNVYSLFVMVLTTDTFHALKKLIWSTNLLLYFVLTFFSI